MEVRKGKDYPSERQKKEPQDFLASDGDNDPSSVNIDVHSLKSTERCIKRIIMTFYGETAFSQ